MTEPVAVLVGFARGLRARGLSIGVGRVVTYCRAAAALAPLDREGLYWAGRTALVARHGDISIYDEEFRRYFSDRRLQEVLNQVLPQTAAVPQVEVETVGAGWDLAGEDDADEEGTPVALIASRVEALRHKSFHEMDEAERAAADRAIRSLAVRIPRRRSRRLRPAPRGRFDVRRTIRASLRTQGEPFARVWRRRTTTTRPLVLVLDVSGSMSPYARALLQFGYAARRAGRRVEVFCFGTRLTRITAALAHKHPDVALADAASAVQDWSGGTLIGESLRMLLLRYSQTSALRGSVCVICSDGLERGEPEVVAAQAARLGRLAHRLIWVNPLKGDPRYEPLARGMAAALPHVDVFLAGHNLASLERLAETVEAA